MPILVKPKLLAMGLFVLVVVSFATIYVGFNPLVRQGIETVGPALTGTTVEVKDVDISPFSGRGTLRGMVVGNPRGSKNKYAFRLPEVHLKLVPLSILRDKIIVREIVVDSPLINYEKQGDTTNLERLTNSVQAAIGGRSAKKLQIDRFQLNDARVRASGQVFDGRSIEVPPLSVELEGLGKDAQGASVAEVSAEVIQTVKKRATVAVLKKIATFGAGGSEGEAEATGSAQAGEGAVEDKTPSREGSRRRRRRHDERRHQPQPE